MDNEINVNGPQSVSVELDYENNKPETSNPQIAEDIQQENFQANETQENSEENDLEIKKPKSKRWEKERKSREEKYLLTQELAAEKKRNLELQSYLERAVDNNTISSADQALRNLEIAEIAHARALEEGDAFSAAKASSQLVQANLAVEKAMNSRIYSKENDNNDYSYINPTAYASANIMHDWLADNPEFNEDSDYYNPNLLSKVVPVIEKLDAKLKRSGNEHLISSPQYFEVVDTIVSQVKGNRGYNRPFTTSVNTSRRISDNQGSKPQLTEQQRIVAAGCNMSEAQYAAWLQKYARDKQNRNEYEY